SCCVFFFSSRRRHTRFSRDWSSDVCSSDLNGLGGAGFPTAVKLTARPQQKIHTLVINGTECEPYITADDVLMREKAAELVVGIRSEERRVGKEWRSRRPRTTHHNNAATHDN